MINAVVYSTHGHPIYWHRMLIDPACRPAFVDSSSYVANHHKTHFEAAISGNSVLIYPGMHLHGFYTAAGTPTMANERSIYFNVHDSFPPPYLPPPHCRVHLDHVWCSFSSTIVGRSKRYFLGSDWKWYAINKNITTQYSPIKSGFGQWRNHFYAHTICAKAIVRAHRKSLKNRLTPASFSFIFVFSN